MTEVSESTSSAEIIDFEEVLRAAVASARSHKSDEEAMSALLIQHLNIITQQMNTEETLRREIALLEDLEPTSKGEKIQQFIPVN